MRYNRRYFFIMGINIMIHELITYVHEVDSFNRPKKITLKTYDDVWRPPCTAIWRSGDFTFIKASIKSIYDVATDELMKYILINSMKKLINQQIKIKYSFERLTYRSKYEFKIKLLEMDVLDIME